MSTLYLIRHFDAGEPWQYPKDDSDRPLNAHGREQAHELKDQVSSCGIEKIYTSFADRCQQSVQYLARESSIPVEESVMLANGRGSAMAPFLRSLSDETALVCTHLDNIQFFLRAIKSSDRVAVPERVLAPCGSFYVLERTGNIFTSVTYVPPGADVPAPAVFGADEWIV